MPARGVAITRRDHGASDLRREAAATSDAGAARRMLAIALVMEGQPRGVAARACGMDRQTLRDWVHRFNDQGLAGLSDRQGGGPKRRLSDEQEAQVSAWVRSGPDPATDGVVRWRRVDLQAKIAKEFGAALHERSVGKLLHRQGFRWMSVRPRHPAADAEAQEAHKKTFPNWSPPQSPRAPEASPWSSGGRTKRVSANKAA
jgi:transposase